MGDAIFGGTFDPVHRGHVHLLREVLERTAINRIILVPSPQNPLKEHQPRASDTERLDMLQLAIEPIASQCTISTIELERSPPVYSLETVRQLVRSGVVQRRPGFLMGDDLVPELPRWERWQQFLEEVQPVVITRTAATDDLFNAYPYLPTDSVLVNAPPVAVSSRTIRTLGTEGWDREETRQALEDLVPSSVARYIRDHGLYN